MSGLNFKNIISKYDKRLQDENENRKQLDNFYARNTQFNRAGTPSAPDARISTYDDRVYNYKPYIPSAVNFKSSLPSSSDMVNSNSSSLSMFSAIDKAIGKKSYGLNDFNSNIPTISASKNSSIFNNSSSSDNGIFTSSAFDKYKQDNPDTPDWLKPIGFALESPFRIPAVNRLFSSAAKVAGGESAIADNAPINTYSTDTRNSFLNKSADVLGGLVGFGLSPRVMGYNGGDANIFKAGNNVAEGASTKLGTFIKNPLLNKTATTLTRGAIDGGLGNLAYDIGQNKDINELPQSALIGAAGGAALFGLGGLASGGSKLSKMATSKLDEAINNIGSKTDYTPQKEALIAKGTNTLDNIETPLIEARNKPNILNPKGMNFNQTIKNNIDIPKYETTIPIENRTAQNVGARNVKAISYEYGELKPHVQQAAAETLTELENSTKGTRTAHYDNITGETIVTGTKKNVSSTVKNIQDDTGLSYDKIRKGLEDIIADHGKENNAASKKIELSLDHRLTYGATDELGNDIPPIADYILTKADIEDLQKGQLSVGQAATRKPISQPQINNTNSSSSILQKNFPIGSNVSFKANMGRGKGEVIGYKTDKWGNEWVEVDTGVKSQTGIGTIKDFKRIDDDIKLEGSNKTMAANIENNTAQKNISMPQNESTITNNDEIAASLGNQVKESKFKSNTWENSPFMADEATQKMVKDIDATYDVQTNEENLKVAAYRLNKDFNGVVDRITKEGIQTAEDSVASGLITNRLIQEAKTTGDYSKVSSWLKVVRPEVTNLAQSLQALSTWKRLTPEGTLLKAQKIVDGAVDNVKKSNPKKFEEVQKTAENITKQMDEIDKKALEQVTNEMDNVDNIINNSKAKNKKEELTPSEKLAKKVEGTTKETKPKTLDKETTLVNTLFEISKKDLPKKEKAMPTNPIEFVKLALSNKKQYHQVWKDAQNIISEKFGIDSEEYSMLKDWIDSKLKPTFYKNDLNKAISETLKQKGIDLKKVVKEHYSVNSNVRKDLIKTLTDSGLSTEDAKTLSGYINSRMKELTKQNKELVLKNMFKDKPTSKQQSMIEKALELNNLGAFKNENYKGLIYEKFGIPQLTNEDIKFITDQMEKVRMLEDPRLRDIEFAGVKQLIADKIVPTFTDKIKAAQRISLLLNTKTMTRNILGNVVMSGLENAKDVPGAAIDKLISKTTGQRTTLMPSVEGIKTQIKGGVKGVKEAVEDYKLGINTNPSAGQYELPSAQAFKSGVMGKLEKVTNAGLTLGDRPFWQGAYDDALRQQLKINKVKEPTEEMIKAAQDIANERTFQNTNALVKGFKDIQKALNLGKDFGLGNFVIPFTKTPANILDKAIDYSPIGGVKGVYNLINGLKKGALNQKQVVDQLGRGITGSTLMAIGYAMAKGGVLTGQANKDKDVATLEKQAGKSPYAVKTGDTYRTIDWMQPAAIPLMIGADIFHQGKNEKELKNVIANAVVSGGNTLFNQSLLQGIQKFFNTSNSSSGGIMENIGNTITQAPTQFVPSALKEINQLIDNKQRDTSGGVINQIKAKVPGLAQTLPVKYDTMGREMKTYKNGNNLWNVGFNPGFTTTYSPSDGEKAALDIFEENGNKTQFPQVMDNKITYTDSKTKKKAVVDLTPKEKQELQKNVGQRVNDKFSTIKGGSVEDRIKDMEKILRDIKKEEEDKILRAKGLSRK